MPAQGQRIRNKVKALALLCLWLTLVQNLTQSQDVSWKLFWTPEVGKVEGWSPWGRAVSELCTWAGLLGTKETLFGHASLHRSDIGCSEESNLREGQGQSRLGGYQEVERPTFPVSLTELAGLCCSLSRRALADKKTKVLSRLLRSCAEWDACGP